MEIIRSLLASNFAPHIYCLRASGAAPVDAVSDLAIALAYLAIPLALISFFRKRRDLQFSWMFVLFGIFILSCGLTHVLGFWTLWHPVYRLEALIKVVTAVSSVLTAIMLWRVLPALLLIPSPERLQAEIQERKAAEQEIRNLNAELETRVLERTAELTETNAILRAREEALRSAEERLRLTLEGGNIGTWDYDVATGTIVLDERAKVAFGLKPEDAVDREALLASVASNSLNSLREQLIDAGQLSFTNGRFATDLRIHGLKDGSTRTIFVQGRSLFADEDPRKPARIVGTSVDITERKQQEEELLRANDDLRQFAFAAAHDLQEPLRNISVAVQLLEIKLTDKLDGEAKELINQSVESSQRMNTMLKDLLTYSRVVEQGDHESGKIPASQALEDAIRNLQSRVQESGAEIVASALPCVQVSQTHLSQLFQNLVGNAIKYRRADCKPQIRIAAKRDNDRWLFEVADNGIGFNPAYSEKIFGMFKRLNPRHEYSGNGIGLAICKRIVKHYGGSIWAESNPGEGSVFRFTLPA